MLFKRALESGPWGLVRIDKSINSNLSKPTEDSENCIANLLFKLIIKIKINSTNRN